MVRGDLRGMMSQLYDARMVEGIGSPNYGRSRFDTNRRCNEVRPVDVSPSSGDVPSA